MIAAGGEIRVLVIRKRRPVERLFAFITVMKLFHYNHLLIINMIIETQLNIVCSRFQTI